MGVGRGGPGGPRPPQNSLVLRNFTKNKFDPEQLHEQTTFTRTYLYKAKAQSKKISLDTPMSSCRNLNGFLFGQAIFLQYLYVHTHVYVSL